MHGLVSLLDPPHYEKIEAIWDELDKRCGLSGVKITPFPHFSWQIAADYSEPQTEQILTTITSQSKPFRVHTGGLGIFSGVSPVIFISLVKSPELEQLHTKLWEQFSGSAKGLSPLYSPQRWVPHVTLIFGEANRSSLLSGLELLAFRSFDWEIEVNNLSFLSQSEGQVGTFRYRHDFLLR